MGNVMLEEAGDMKLSLDVKDLYFFLPNHIEVLESPSDDQMFYRLLTTNFDKIFLDCYVRTIIFETLNVLDVLVLKLM